MNEDQRDLRLFDLERIGPFLYWPPARTLLNDYGASTPPSSRTAVFEEIWAKDNLERGVAAPAC